jgi:hypothetical protein
VKIPNAAIVKDNLRGPQPRWRLAGDALKELLARVAIDVTMQDLRPIDKVGQHHGSNRAVIVEKVALGVSGLRPEHLLQVGQDELVVRAECRWHFCPHGIQCISDNRSLPTAFFELSAMIRS